MPQSLTQAKDNLGPGLFLPNKGSCFDAFFALRIPKLNELVRFSSDASQPQSHHVSFGSVATSKSEVWLDPHLVHRRVLQYKKRAGVPVHPASDRGENTSRHVLGLSYDCRW